MPFHTPSFRSRIVLLSSALLAILLFGCHKTGPQVESSDLSTDHKRVGPPTTLQDRIAVLSELGFSEKAKFPQNVEFFKDHLTVSLGTTKETISVVPMFPDRSEYDVSMEAPANDILTKLGIFRSPVIYDRQIPTSDVGPEFHTATLPDWTIRKRIWRDGIGGMFVTIEAVKR